MDRFLELTDAETTEPVLVAVANILFISPADDDASSITMVGGEVLTVSISLDRLSTTLSATEIR